MLTQGHSDRGEGLGQKSVWAEKMEGAERRGRTE